MHYGEDNRPLTEDEMNDLGQLALAICTDTRPLFERAYTLGIVTAKIYIVAKGTVPPPVCNRLTDPGVYGTATVEYFDTHNLVLHVGLSSTWYCFVTADDVLIHELAHTLAVVRRLARCKRHLDRVAVISRRPTWEEDHDEYWGQCYACVYRAVTTGHSLLRHAATTVRQPTMKLLTNGSL